VAKTYAAANCAVVGLMRILAIEGAEYGILVNTVSPVGYTRMHPAAGSRLPEANGKAAMPVAAVAPVNRVRSSPAVLDMDTCN
jgi:NAD(P)-dependent dehydrogenase (short-subunit alcohol dehydrogenase family)